MANCIVICCENRGRIPEISNYKSEPCSKFKSLAHPGDTLESIAKYVPHREVVGLARRKERLEQLRNKTSNKTGKLHPFQTDISNEKEILEAFEWTKKNLGPVHVLVNNAGINVEESLSEGLAENWNKIFQVNVIGLSIATREALKDMKANNVDGHIIHINSIGGHQILKMPNLAMYTASKHSVTTLTESLRYELATSGSKTKVTSISPGLVDTEMVPDHMKDVPMLQASDIADGVVYALSTPPRVQIHELTIRPIGEKY